MFQIVFRTREVDQYPSHQPGRNRKEVCSVLPTQIFSADQADVCFMDQSGGLQSMTRALTPNVTLGQAMQLFVNDRHKPFTSRFVTIAPSQEQLRYVIG